MSDIVIHAEKLGKKYTIGHQQVGDEKYLALRDMLMHNAAGLWRKTRDLAQGKPLILGDTLEEVWALRDVSFEIRRGEAIGIIGRNGAGKSTLLKVLSRITEPSAGRVTIKGRVACLLEVGTGFHPELTGRENVYLNGAILGMTRAEIRRKFDEIVAFAELEKFLDTPVKRYSSGMYMRLAFAVAAHLEPEILLVDEVLAVGDAQFQKKCLGKMSDVANEGRTVLFVSHNMAAIHQLCPSAVWIDKGFIRNQGAAPEIISTYLREADQSGGMASCVFEEDARKEFQLRRGRLTNAEGAVARSFSCDEPVTVELLCQVHRPLPGLYGYLQISRMDGVVVLVSDSFDAPPNRLDGLEAGYHTVRIELPARSLAPGDYAVYVNFTSHSGMQGFNVDSPGTILTFELNDHLSIRGNRRGGYFSMLLAWAIDPVDEFAAEQTGSQS
jgi:lipopolysaccharide transport system ATP-binding protein